MTKEEVMGLVKRLRDPQLAKRWWDQYCIEAADALESLIQENSSAFELPKKPKQYKIGHYGPTWVLESDYDRLARLAKRRGK